MDDDLSTATLVERAVGGDALAWDGLVRRYVQLLRAVCHRYGMTGADADDVCGVVWLRLVLNLADLREPATLPAWLATTVRRECLDQLRRRQRQTPCAIDDQRVVDEYEPAPDARLLLRERQMVVQKAVAQLPDRERQLLSMLFSDPPTPYLDISAKLGMPIGAIGPTRQRCLARLRRDLPESLAA
jgi:RNA polymerase sigma factor (sigma-70 family)